MRLMHICAALSGAVALGMLAIGSHAVSPADAGRVQIGGFVQLAAAITGLVLAPRPGRLNFVAGAMILAGAVLFAGTLYAIAITQSRAFVMAAPVGGTTLILGWIVLAFASPKT